MKILNKTLLCTAIAAVSAPASAAIIYKDVAYGADAATAESAFLADTYNRVTEGFEGFNPSAAQDADGDGYQAFVANEPQKSWVLAQESFSTSVGTFSLTSSQSAEGDDVEPEKLMIEDSESGEFGRENLGKWLDSNDALSVKWNIMDGEAGKRNAIGFYLSDANDINASLKLEFEDGSVSDDIEIASPLSNSNIAYITIFSDIFFDKAYLTFNNGEGTNDGWGIDNVSVARVPEPGTLALLGLGLAALGLGRSRKIKH
ncbi:hypothetical protein ACP86_00120 [Marinobacter sp. CP1]|jgi:hypothetical protein|uniref:PEP-CTERM sorting domain-containing protein n=1 Tax=unclassified Marinobacter TaxID=83889 RepID=UPI00069D15F1|nr:MULTISPECIES: PEP-CTERM sorting domain-containing protein [unclassified Marinobacter]AKV94705.1 hypothetical protein ACP86_00120 [Marinobacter sp. CP1]